MVTTNSRPGVLSKHEVTFSNFSTTFRKAAPRAATDSALTTYSSNISFWGIEHIVGWSMYVRYERRGARASLTCCRCCIAWLSQRPCPPCGRSQRRLFRPPKAILLVCLLEMELGRPGNVPPPSNRHKFRRHSSKIYSCANAVDLHP